MIYRCCGKSSIHLPVISLAVSSLDLDALECTLESLLENALDLGLLHWDLSSTTNSLALEKRVFHFIKDRNCRDQIFLSSNVREPQTPFFRAAGRRGIRQELDRFLSASDLDYLDLLYIEDIHGDVPPEESIEALHREIIQGRVLYGGLKDFNTSDSQCRMDLMSELNIPMLLHQQNYSPEKRTVERTLDHLLEVSSSRLAARGPFVPQTKEVPWSDLAMTHEMTAQQLALKWVLRQEYCATVLLAPTSIKKLAEAEKVCNNLKLSDDLIAETEMLLKNNPRK